MNDFACFYKKTKYLGSGIKFNKNRKFYKLILITSVYEVEVFHFFPACRNC